jgi:hypothetical protein
VSYILERFGKENVGIFYGALVYLIGYLVKFMVFLYSFSHFGILYQEESGNPGLDYACVSARCIVTLSV